MLNDLMFTDSEDEELNGERRGIIRRRKTYRARINFQFLANYEYNERFRMTAEKLEILLQVIGPHLRSPSLKSGALTAKQKLCVALHWLGSGSQFHVIGDAHGISKATVNRCVKSVVNAVNRHLFHTIVKWPQDIGRVINEFYTFANFPHVCGIIDGSLIPIEAPTHDEVAFVDRYGQHSINCMFVCGPTCLFYYVSARWPGSVHDSRVLRTSSLHRTMEAENIFPNAVLLGDSGYPLRTWLMTPLHHDPNNEREQRYNRRLKSTRQIIERALGILKEKFPCLNFLRLNPVYACNIVKCCATLCNFARQDEDEIPFNDNRGQVEEEGREDERVHEFDRPPAARIRQQEILNLMI